MLRFKNLTEIFLLRTINKIVIYNWYRLITAWSLEGSLQKRIEPSAQQATGFAAAPPKPPAVNM